MDCGAGVIKPSFRADQTGKFMMMATACAVFLKLRLWRGAAALVKVATGRDRAVLANVPPTNKRNGQPLLENANGGSR
jgi:hypothetical protein